MRFDGMYGLGDNLYQRAVVRERARQGELWLATPWPQLYADLPGVHLVRPTTQLRTQAKNVLRAWPHWTQAPKIPAGMPARRAHYVGYRGTMLQGLCVAYGLAPDAPLAVDVPRFPRYADLGQRRPYVVVRPATIRAEWRADARNPEPAYLAQAAARARAAGYRVISIADLAWPHEWLDGQAPPADVTWHAGELMLEQLIELVAGAAGVIGGVGFLVPLALATRTPMLLLYGGWGAANGPQRILDARLPSDTLQQVFPDHYCQCNDARHGCDKTITDLDRHCDEFFARLARR